MLGRRSWFLARMRACVSFVVAPSPRRSKAVSLTQQARDNLYHHDEVGQVSDEASRRDFIGHRPRRAAMYCLGPVLGRSVMGDSGACAHADLA